MLLSKREGRPKEKENGGEARRNCRKAAEGGTGEDADKRWVNEDK